MSASSPPSFREDRSLAEAINVVSRPVHGKLNRLILSRLPLALPPNAQDPSLYATGMLHVASIYATFESLWADLLASHSHNDSSTKSSPEKGGAKPGHDAESVPDQLIEALGELRLPGLMRSQKIMLDVQCIMGWSPEVTKVQLEIISKTGHLAEMLQHIERVVRSRPHVLLAYSHIMFMALFAGGRFLRATLELAGGDFWGSLSSPAASPAEQQRDAQVPDAPLPGWSEHQSPLRYLRFFCFDTFDDGQGLKREFKKRFANAEKILTRKQKHDIVQEGVCIFENLILLVAQLDSLKSESLIDRKSSLDVLASMIDGPFLRRFRDSLAVTRLRSARGAQPKPTGRSDIDRIAPPNIPHLFGAPVCPVASPKSMRFERTGHPARSAEASKTQLTESIEVTSEQIRRERVTNWALGFAIILLALGFVLSGRPIAPEATS
ncbi:heme oxygenase [Moelleriella libera RCEF 2490]|uniref:Heme oxygenase n=1 Tax=Moelleriella libera RCEF 2490 TaxID=1081109 RepID=A0A168E2M3_9HYPO|nr:heme oxygenase [Moelleriella libera RCEF 2490]